jgi:hypothetical protein
MSNLNDRAREIFLDNRGNRELMKENKSLKEYEKYKISKDMEITWKNEYINEQFIKADAQSIDVIQLVNNICGIIISFKDYSDYKKLLSIKNKYLTESDIFEQIMYFKKVIDSMLSILTLNNAITNKAKLEMACELEAMIIETINKKDDMPDKLYKDISKRYGLETKVDYSNTTLSRINNEVKQIKMTLLNLD